VSVHRSIPWFDFAIDYFNLYDDDNMMMMMMIMMYVYDVDLVVE
jgi:hypothetical protein